MQDVPAAVRREDKHRQLVEAVITLKENPAEKKRTGCGGQLKALETQRAIKLKAIAFSRWVSRFKVQQEDAADFMNIPARTLRNWERGWRRDHLSVRCHGRPQNRATRVDRNLVYVELTTMGETLAVETLLRGYPHIARREMEDIVQRYRALVRKQKTLTLHELKWQKAGAVWAMDFAEPPRRRRIDNIYRYILSVRDLASSMQLAWGGITAESSENVISILKALFDEYGVPLVLKSDNQGPFVSEEIKRYLFKLGIVQLLSPKYYPSYNGACEAGIHAMKDLTRKFAAAEGHHGFWTIGNLEMSREQANHSAMSHMDRTLTPIEAWEKREQITPQRRLIFLKAVKEEQTKARIESGVSSGLFPDMVLSDDDPETTELKIGNAERHGISRALENAGFLMYRRRVISPPLRG